MGLPLPSSLSKRALSMGHYLHRQNQILISLSIVGTLFISPVQGQVNRLPSSQLITVSAIHPVDVDVSIVLCPVPPVTFNGTSRTNLRSILGDTSGVNVTDIHVSGVERKGPCSSKQKDGGPGSRKLQQGGEVQVVASGRASRYLLIESEDLGDRGVEDMCWHEVGVEDTAVQSMREPAKWNVTLTIRTEDRRTVADRILLAKQAGALEKRLNEAGLKDGNCILSVVVESDSPSTPQFGPANGVQQVQASILISRTSVSDFTSERVEALKSFLASSTGVPLDAISLVDVKREVGQGAQTPQGKRTIDQSPVDLNATFALYTAKPAYVSAALWKAARNGFLDEIIDGAELRVLNSTSDADQDITQKATSGQVIGTDTGVHQSKNAMSWWKILLLAVGAVTILVLPCCAAYLNKFRIRNFSTLKAPTPDIPLTKKGTKSTEKPQSLELPSGGSPQGNGKIQSFLPVLGTTAENVLSLPYSGRNGMQIDTFMDRYEAKPQWRTTHKTVPSIRDNSTESESGGVLSDSFSDYDLDITPTGAQLRRIDPNTVDATEDLFFTMTDPSIHTPTSDRGSKRSIDEDRPSLEGPRCAKRSDVSVSDYLSADDEEVTPRSVPVASTVVRPVELTTSVDLPPSPYSLSARTRDSPVTSVPKVPRLFVSLIESSDLEYDYRSGEGNANAVSQYQYRTCDQESRCEGYNRQYVNYLFDAPPSTSRTNTSDTTSPGTLSGNNGYRMRNLNSRC